MTKKDLLQISPYKEDGGQMIGKHPNALKSCDTEGFFRRPALKAMRLKCLDCCGGLPGEVRKCVSVNCPLWPYRMGSRPKTIQVQR